MNLENPKKKLIVQEKQFIKPKPKQLIQRANWLILEQEQRIKDKEMAHKQSLMQLQYELEQEKGRLIENRIDSVIKRQEEIDRKFNQNNIDWSRDGPLKDFNHKLDDFQTRLRNKSPLLQSPIVEEEQISLQKSKQHSKQLRVSQKPSGLRVSSQNIQKQTQEKKYLGDREGVRKQRLISEQKISVISRHTNSVGESENNGSCSPLRKSKSRSSDSRDKLSQTTKRYQNISTISPPKDSTKLIQMVEEAERKYGSITQFSDSLKDRQNILNLKMIPSIRNKLGSLKRKDRQISDLNYVSSPRGQHQRSQSLNLQAYQQRNSILREKLNQKFNQIRDKHLQMDNPANYHVQTSRPISIADSEIQKVSDLELTLLNHETSLASLQSSRINSDQKVLGLNRKSRKLGNNNLVYVESKPAYGFDNEIQNNNLTSLPDIKIKHSSRLIQIEQVNIDKQSHGEFHNHQNQKLNQLSDPSEIDQTQTHKIDKVFPGQVINLQELNIKLPGRSAIFESRPKVINRNPFQDKFAAAEALLSERQKIKQMFFRKSQMSPVSTNSKKLKTDISRGIQQFNNENQYPQSTIHAISSKNQFNFNQASNYLTVDASSIQLAMSPNYINQVKARKPGIFSSLDHSTDTILTPQMGNEKTSIMNLKSNNQLQQSIIQRNKQEDICTSSKKLLVSQIDIKKNNDFEVMKQKYTSQVPTLMQEQQKFKDKLNTQKQLIKKMKQSKLRTASIQ